MWTRRKLLQRGGGESVHSSFHIHGKVSFPFLLFLSSFGFSIVVVVVVVAFAASAAAVIVVSASFPLHPTNPFYLFPCFTSFFT